MLGYTRFCGMDDVLQPLKMFKFEQCVCSLWILERGVPNLIGSGTLLKIKRSTFLITAAHVIANAGTQQLLMPGSEGLIKISGIGKTTQSCQTNTQNDRTDTAIVLLDEEIAKIVETLYKSLPIAFVDVNDSWSPKKAYAFFGFPWRKGGIENNSVLVEPPIYIYQSLTIAETDFTPIGLSTEMHIAIHFDLRHAFDADKRRYLTAPNPQGMSGGAVWSFVPIEINGEQMLTRRLVGIAIEYIASRRVLVGTRINAALEGVRIISPCLAQFVP